MATVDFSQFFFSLFPFWLCCREPIAWFLIPTCETNWLAQSSHSSAHRRNCSKMLEKKTQQRTWSLSRSPYCVGACLIACSASLLCCLFTVHSLPFSVVSLPEVTRLSKSSSPPSHFLSLQWPNVWRKRQQQDASRWQSFQCTWMRSFVPIFFDKLFLELSSLCRGHLPVKYWRKGLNSHAMWCV